MLVTMEQVNRRQDKTRQSMLRMVSDGMGCDVINRYGNCDDTTLKNLIRL